MAILDFDISDVALPGGDPGTAISLTGSIDASTNQQFEQELTDILTKGVKKVILVLRGIKYINSTGLGTIVKCVDIFREAGGDIKMVGIPTKVIALFEMLGLLALFETFDDIEDAVNSFGAEETEEAAAAGPKRMKADFPIQLKCTSCSAGVNIKNAGKYKCPKCGDYFSAEEDGTVETYAIRKPNVIQMQLPSDKRFVESVKLMAASAAGRFGVTEDALLSISASIDEVFSMFADGTPLPNDNVGILIVTDEKKFSIGFVNYSDTLGIADGDMRLQMLQQHMDEVELINLPSKGNMLKLNKVFAA